MTPQYFHAESYLGGGERYPHNTARGVVRATGGRTTVKIISFGPERREVALDDGVTLSVLPVAYPPDHQLNPVSWEIVDAVAEADVVHAHQAFTRPGEAAILASSVLGKPVFATDLGAWASTLGMRYEMLELCAGVICISDFSAQMLHTSAPVSVVRGGVDTEKFTPPATAAARDRVLYVGRVLPHKGIDNLIAAMPPDLPLVICGTPYDDAYHRHLLQLAETRQVTFQAGASDEELLDHYRNALATVLPSVYRDYAGNHSRAPELMGLTLVESMACGTPAICSRVGGMPELVREGETGFVYDTVEQLRGLIESLRDGTLDAEAVGASGRAAAVADYDIGVVGGRFMELYAEGLSAS